MDQALDLSNLRLFAEVVERDSFTTAGGALGLQSSKLSRSVRALAEDRDAPDQLHSHGLSSDA
jgi:DNA-binding transcriptional LysR family regulator